VRKGCQSVVLFGILVAANGCWKSGATPEVSPDRFCAIKLEQIGRAVAEYRSEHGDLPQATLDPGGFRRSWRVVLAPYLLAHSLHPGNIDYKEAERWDSPHNRVAFENSFLMGCFTCPLESRHGHYPFTSYIMLVRPGAHSEGAAKAPPPSLPGEAVLIVESAHCDIKYAEPKDLDWDALWQGGSPFGPGKLNSLHPKIVRAVRVDGVVIEIPKTIGRDALRDLLDGRTKK